MQPGSFSVFVGFFTGTCLCRRSNLGNDGDLGSYGRMRYTKPQLLSSQCGDQTESLLDSESLETAAREGYLKGCWLYHYQSFMLNPPTRGSSNFLHEYSIVPLKRNRCAESPEGFVLSARTVSGLLKRRKIIKMFPFHYNRFQAAGHSLSGLKKVARCIFIYCYKGFSFCAIISSNTGAMAL